LKVKSKYEKLNSDLQNKAISSSAADGKEILSEFKEANET
jgi:hypothetical protein